MPLNEIYVEGEEVFKMAQALSSRTSFRILQLLANEKLDISTIALRLDLSEAYISEEISNLEDLNLIKVSYSPGKRGIRKICELQVSKIILFLKN
ncbi:MAG: ArsR family transcriptional regulator [Nitrososphaeria archaeon]